MTTPEITTIKPINPKKKKAPSLEEAGVFSLAENARLFVFTSNSIVKGMIVFIVRLPLCVFFN